MPLSILITIFPAITPAILHLKIDDMDALTASCISQNIINAQNNAVIFTVSQFASLRGLNIAVNKIDISPNHTLLTKRL